jgi:hypothetical protein
LPISAISNFLKRRKRHLGIDTGQDSNLHQEEVQVQDHHNNHKHKHQ